MEEGMAAAGIMMIVCAAWDVTYVLVLIANAFGLRLPMFRAFLEAAGIALVIAALALDVSVWLGGILPTGQFLFALAAVAVVALNVKFFSAADLYGDAHQADTGRSPPL